MLCGLTGSVLELRIWVKSSFESSGLGFCFKHAPAKARDGVRERNFGFPRRGHFVMKVILGNAHMYLHLMYLWEPRARMLKSTRVQVRSLAQTQTQCLALANRSTPHMGVSENKVYLFRCPHYNRDSSVLGSVFETLEVSQAS